MSGGIEEMYLWEEADRLKNGKEADKENSSWNEVISDIKERERFGAIKYGKYLTAYTHEDTLQHLYEELLDAVVYIKTEINKRKEKDVRQEADLGTNIK